MIRLFDIIEKVTDRITFRTSELMALDYMPYVVYDTSTGVTTMQDYICWRTITTSTGTYDDDNVAYFKIDNTNLYPSYTTAISDYSALGSHLLSIISLSEYNILQNVLLRIDTVRRRFPNPGVGITSQSGVGQDGVVSFAGGYEKKFTVTELIQMIQGAMIEINLHPPATNFWPTILTKTQDKMSNPYSRSEGLPFKMSELVVQGALIRCLVAWGLLEVDLQFTTSDSGLQISFDRVASVQSWHTNLLQDYQNQKTLLKWDCANHYGVGIGTVPWAATGWLGTALNNIQTGGTLAMTSLLGYYQRGNVPM